MTTTLAIRHTTDITTAHRIDELMDRFIADIDVKYSSKALYRRTLRQYFNWVVIKGYDLRDITRAELLEYKANLFSNGLSSLTVGSYITSVRLFYGWAESHKLYPDVAKGIKTPVRKQQFRKSPLTTIQVKALLTHFQGRSLRDYAIISLLLRTGLRTIEISRASVGDITRKSGQRILMIQGKGRDEKDDFCVLTDKAYQPIADYLATRESLTPDEPLFISGSNNGAGGSLSTRTISFIAKSGLQAIRLDEKVFTAHSLRHTTAINILRAGGSMDQVQSTLRHSNPATSQIYTATIREEQRLENSGEALIDSLY